MELSIIIVNYEMGNYITQCIDSIYKETKKIDFEIIIVDNSRSRNDHDVLKEKFPGIIIHFNDKNLGFSKACNQGILLSSGKMILFLNPDTIVLNGAIDRVYEFINEDSDAGIVGCKLLNFDGTLQYSCKSFPSIWNLFCEAIYLYRIFPKTKLFGSYHMSCFDYDSIQDVDVVMGAFMMLKRGVIDSIGKFDESYFMYSEETDLCYRAIQKGWKVQYYPNSEIMHRWGGMSDGLIDRLSIEVHKSLMIFCRKNHKLLYFLIEKSIVFFGVVLRFIYYVIFSSIIRHRSLFRKKNKYAAIVMSYIRGI
tara:strand:- start:1390 stop:2313 length:924 start_codon:yes stop_codon:yes gene_type:complete